MAKSSADGVRAGSQLTRSTHSTLPPSEPASQPEHLGGVKVMHLDQRGLCDGTFVRLEVQLDDVPRKVRPRCSAPISWQRAHV
jgi:hypothetical protein